MTDDPVIRYIGGSMRPTFLNHDMLTYEQVMVSDLRKGDIIIFTSPESGIYVIHRVISVGKTGVRTQGDNNRGADSYTLSQSEICGRVISGRRGKVNINIRNGASGRIQMAGHRFRKKMRSYVMYTLKPPYDIIAESRIISRLTFARLNIRVVRFHGPSGPEHHAMLGNRCIATLPAGSGRWIVRPPYRIIIDETNLPAGDQL